MYGRTHLYLLGYWGCGKQLESAPELKPLCDTPLLLVR
jgi:hypothetical protein